MRLAKFLTSVAIASLATSPVMAQSAASKLSTAGKARAATSAKKSNQAVGGFLVPAVAIIAIIGGVLVITDGSGEPDSP